MNQAPQISIKEIHDNAPVWKRSENAWPDPEPIFSSDFDRTPYPVNHLPPLLQSAILEYQRYGQQPIELVATSALATCSLACQGLADVRRDKELVGPCSLSFLVVAESGERKTAADRRMTRVIKQWMALEKDANAAEVARASARRRAWEAERAGLESKIKSVAGDVEKIRPFETRLAELEQNPPAKFLLPDLFNEDVTPEALARHMAEGWPSSSLWSDEGGLVVGSHGMSEDSVIRFLSLLNRLWDGNDFKRKRVSASSFEIVGRRFTCSLMLQEIVLHQLLGVGGGAARGTGTIARFFNCLARVYDGKTALYRSH